MGGNNRNAPCSCGSGKKYKKCCALKSKLERMNATVLKTSSEKGESVFQNQFSQIGRSYTSVVTERNEKVKADIGLKGAQESEEVQDSKEAQDFEK